MSDNGAPVRRSVRPNFGKIPKRYGDGVPTVRRRRTTEAVMQQPEVPGDDGRSSRSWQTVNSKASKSSSAARRMLEVDMKAMEEIDEIEEELQNLEMMKLVRKKALVEKRKQLQKAIIAEEEGDDLEYWEDGSQHLSDEDVDAEAEDNSISPVIKIVKSNDDLKIVAPAPHGADENFTSPKDAIKSIDSCSLTSDERKKVEDWLQTGLKNDESDKPIISIPINDELVKLGKKPTEIEETESPNATISKPAVKSEDSSLKTYLARQTVAKELPLFSGDPVEWPKFIAHYRSSTEACGFSNVENMARLEKALRGKAKEAVQCMLAIPDKVEAAITRLEKNFGRPELILKILTERAEMMPNVRDEKPEALMEFANAIENLTSTAEVLKKKEFLANPFLMEKLMDKLSPGMRRDWGARAKHLIEGTMQMESFSIWVTGVAEEVAAVSTPLYSSCRQEEKKPQRGGRGRGAMCGAIEQKKISECGFCRKFGHNISICREFAKKSSEERWKWAVDEKLCFSCLDSQHRTISCLRKKKCGKDGCEKFHHPWLHAAKEKEDSEVKLVSHTAVDCSKVPLCVLPVTVSGPKGKMQTYAMLDCASSASLIDAELAEQLGLSGQKRPLKIQWIDAKTSTEAESMQVSLRIQGSNSRNIYNVENFQTVDNLALPLENVNAKKIKMSWKHLMRIPLPELKNVQPKILVGLNNAGLIVPQEVVEGPGNAPIAVKTRLGWALYGNSSVAKDRVDEGFVCHVFKTPDDTLHQMVKDSFRIEDMGVKISEDNLLSREDKRTQEITEQTTRRVEGGWETGLLWKEDNVVLPESKTMALNRLYSLERKMDKNPIFAEQYCGKIQEYLSKGFVRKLSEEERNKASPRTWYLPHFAVFNPNKPKKIRPVFDAAARSRGVCLNDKLLKGLDLLKPLPSVLCKFRQKQIGFGADIRDMFHRVKIRTEDLPSQRFLWRGMDRHRPPDTYVMDVMIFGAVSSPYSAQEVKNRNALTLQPPPSENALRAIVDRHYMDDYLDSVSSREEAEKLVLEVVDIHKKGGFEICNWICSDPNVLDVLPENLRAEGKEAISFESDSSSGEGATERVLGLYWNPARDIFVFTTKLKKVSAELVNGSKLPTKREALSVVMSVFDPLGFLTHLTIKAKILLQDVWRTHTGWDDNLPPQPQEKWKRWLGELRDIRKFEVPRCYFSKISEETKTTLHIFCDASEQAFAAVAYLRMTNVDETETAFVMAKSRVAPLRPESIPRLELQAALLGSRMAKTISEYHEIPIGEKHFWTDSKTVLCWLRSDGRCFKPFVAHRIGEILESTEVGNWHWVPTKENVADEATRDGSPADISPKSRWLRGPAFLQKNEDEWPQELSAKELKEEVSDADLEQKKEFVATISFVHQELLPIVRRFSSWMRLIRSTALAQRYASKIMRRGFKTGEISVDELEKAEVLLLEKVQQESFAEEIACIKKGNPIPRASRLKRLVPMLNEHGLLVLSGRTSLAALDGGPSNHPIILDSKSDYTMLVLKHFHYKAGHHGTERVLNDVRLKYWIIDARTTLKRVVKKCQICKVYKTKPEEPAMGQLPFFRVNPQPRPFTFTGIDYFGPMDVTIGRRHEKRYGALFTCLTTRAVHLEVAGSLNTDSCIMAVRRFIARRGAPKQIWSDNGTNFHGADNELQKALAELDQEKIVGELALKGSSWNFIPPSAPQMGGCWERLVRSVKTALNAVLKSRAPKEEVLQTLFAEAEHSVNSRPLTHVSDDPEDEESLTPNHFLLGGPSGVQNAGDFVDYDLYTRKQWRVSQKLADMFWQRWVKEYLPTLTRRTKDCGTRKQMKVGDLVFIADGDLKRNYWPRGRVEKVFPGKDGVVRVVEIRTSHGTYRRPVVKVALIDVTPEVDVP